MTLYPSLLNLLGKKDLSWKRKSFSSANESSVSESSIVILPLFSQKRRDLYPFFHIPYFYISLYLSGPLSTLCAYSLCLATYLATLHPQLHYGWASLRHGLIRRVTFSKRGRALSQRIPRSKTIEISYSCILTDDEGCPSRDCVLLAAIVINYFPCARRTKASARYCCKTADTMVNCFWNVALTNVNGRIAELCCATGWRLINCKPAAFIRDYREQIDDNNEF